MSDYRKPPAFPADRHPLPFVEGKEEWNAVSEFCWKCAFEHIAHREDLPAPFYMDNGLIQDGAWAWDSAFMAMFARYAPDVVPGVESLDNYYAWQDGDGYIAMAYNFDTQKPRYESPKRINPPLFAWAEWEHYRTTGRQDRIQRVLPHLIAQFDWIMKNRQCEHFTLYWFEDSGSSGMDNSPRGRRNPEAGRHMAWIDLSSQMAWMALCISRLARAAGEYGVADRFMEDWRYIGAQVEKHCWCPVSRFYHDRLDRSNWLSSKTVAGFWPILAEFSPEEHVAGLCEHLENPNTFGRPCPVPSLSYDDPNYSDSGDYWIGGVWAPTNYMIFSGLRKYGRHALARRLAVRYLDHVAHVFSGFERHPGTIWEAYSAERPEPAQLNRDSEKLVAPDFAGWTALAGTAILYEAVLGLDLNVPDGTLTWRIGMTEEHGIRRLPFGSGFVNLRAGRRDDVAAAVNITVESDVDFTLAVEVAGRTREVPVRAGQPVEIDI